VREVVRILLGSPGIKEWVMKNKDNTKSVNKDRSRTRLNISYPKPRDEFSMQVGMEPYSQLGTGRRCKVKGCDQPVYSEKSGLCSYHRMKEAEIEFERGLRARQRQGG
jgi:hypothetical protein